MKQTAALLLLVPMMMMKLPAQNAAAAPSPQAAATAEYNSMVDQYFDAYFHFHPSEATYVGFHQYDDQLEDYSQKARDTELSFLLEAKQAAGYTHTDLLNEEQRLDLKMLASAINARILELQEIRMWQKNPDIYSSNGSASIYLLMSRKFAPPAERLKSVIARERQIPRQSCGSQTQSQEPAPHLHRNRDRAVARHHQLLPERCPDAFKDVTDAQLLAEFKQRTTT